MIIKKLFGHIFGYNSHYIIQCSTVCVNVQIDRLGQIQAEDAHDRFCIDHISSGYKVKVV